jgi:hypothetical protein
MIIMTFDEELTMLIEDARQAGDSPEEIQAAVREFYHLHGREVPPPIVGTVTIRDPSDGFGR